MMTTIDPGRAHRTLNVVDNIVFSRVRDKNGSPVDLKMCLLGQSGNAEMRDADGVVPLEISQSFYDRLRVAGLENQTDFFIVRNGGHGTREFFQREILAELEKFMRHS